MSTNDLIDGKPDRVLIWSNEHRAWWQHNSRGYSPNIAKAGLYDRVDAESIVKNAGSKNEQIIELEFAFVKLQGQAWDADMTLYRAICDLQKTDVMARV